MAVAAKTKDKQKVLNDAKALHAAALAALHAAAGMLRIYLDSDAKIAASRKKVIKFIKANPGKTAQIKAMAKKHNALGAKLRRDFDAKNAKANAGCAANAKKVNAFVKKHKALLKGPKFKQIAEKLEWASKFLAKAVPKKK